MEVLSRFLLDLYRLARHCPVASFQDEALGLLTPQIVFNSARWGSSRLLPNGQREIRHTHLKDETAETLVAYREVMTLDWPMLNLLRNRANPLGVIGYQSVGLFAAKEMAAIRHYQRRFRHENVLNAAQKTESDGVGHFRHMSLYRAREGHRFGESDLAFMHLALPHLLEAQAINAAAADFTPGAGEDPMSSPSNVSDLGGFLLSENASLRALLHAEWPGWTSPRLPSPLWDGLCRQYGFSGTHIVAVALRVEDLVIFRVRRRCAVDALSQRELEVARRIVAGDGHKQIARALGISPTTARNHVQRIHGKLEARNAAGVIAALAPLASGRHAQAETSCLRRCAVKA